MLGFLIKLLVSHFLQSVLAAEVCTALLVEAHELDPSVIAQVQNVLDLLNAAVLQLGDVNHAVVTGSNLNECADGQDADDLAVVQLANLGDEADVVDHLLGSVSSSGVDSGDEDGAIVLDVNLGAGVSADLLNGLAAGTDNLADLVHRNLQHGAQRYRAA